MPSQMPEESNPAAVDGGGGTILITVLVCCDVFQCVFAAYYSICIEGEKLILFY